MPLLNKKFSTLIDSIGGNIFSYGLRELEENGELISIGNLSEQNININILPFILRAVKVIGINTENISPLKRKQVWKLISIVGNNKGIEQIYKVYKFKDIQRILDKASLNKIKGRAVIKLY